MLPAARPALLAAFALLAMMASTVYGQPGYDDGYGPTPTGTGMDPMDGYGVPTAPSAKPTRSKICPETVWSKSGKCSASAFEGCARKVVKAWNDGLVYMTKANVSDLVEHYDSFTLSTGIARFVAMGTFPSGRIPEYTAIFAYPGGVSTFLSPLKYTVRRFIARCPLVVATVDIEVVNNFNKKTGIMTFEEWFRVDKGTSRVASSDVDAPRLGELGAYLGVDAAFQTAPAAVAQALTNPICKTHTQYCINGLQQYSSEAECRAFMAAIPLAGAPTWQGNHTYCRFLHSAFLPYEPEIHCGHIGKRSPVCRDVTYDSYYQDSRFNAPTFVMGGKL